MNIPTQVTNGATNQLVISAVRCALLYCTVTNTSGLPRVYALWDQSTAPPLSNTGPGGGIVSPPISAGGTWRVIPIDATMPAVFGSAGCVFQSFNFGIQISGMTNASPIVVATSSPHGLANSQSVVIAGVTGNTAANGTWPISVVDATHFALIGSQGNGAYVNGGIVTVAGQFPNPNYAALSASDANIVAWSAPLS